MADRFRKRMDSVAGRGGVNCRCCRLEKSQMTSVRMWFNKELQSEINDEYNHQEVCLKTADGKDVVIVDYTQKINLG